MAGRPSATHLPSSTPQAAPESFHLLLSRDMRVPGVSCSNLCETGHRAHHANQTIVPFTFLKGHASLPRFLEVLCGYSHTVAHQVRGCALDGVRSMLGFLIVAKIR